MALTFGYLDEIPGNPPFVEELVTLVLTPQHAKLLSVSFQEIIKAFEAQFGHISTEQNVAPISPQVLQDAIIAATDKEK